MRYQSIPNKFKRREKSIDQLRSSLAKQIKDLGESVEKSLRSNRTSISKHVIKAS